MLTKAKVIAKRESCLASIDTDIVAFATVQNAATPAEFDKMEPKMEKLRAKRTEIAVQDYRGALADPALQAAIEKIDAATSDMTTTAQNMKTATDFLTNVSGYLGAAGKVVSALQG